MPNPYVNKVVQSNGTTLIDISDTTAVASDVSEGKYFYLATGEKVEGTGSGGGDEPSGPTYETYFDDSITIDTYISIPSLADLYFAEGETWRVTWDGVEYICTTAQYQGWLWTVGNQSLASTDDGVNEPFLLYNYGSGAMNGNARTGGTHTLKLEKQTSSGASNIVTGTFKGTTTGAAMDVNLDYSGSGYPVAIIIYPKEGAYNSNSAVYALVQRNATLWFNAVKAYADVAPDYDNDGTEDQYTITNRTKNSSSSSTGYGTNISPSQIVASGGNAAQTVQNVVKLKSNTKMSVYIASSSYGFPANIEFTYHVIYSS